MCRLSVALIFASILVATTTHAEPDSGRVAIVDASINTKTYLDAFAEAGIKVVGRYFSRCPQPEIVPEKRLIDNAGEIQAILAHRSGFGVLSIYQYFNNQPLKFSGKRKISCKIKKGETLSVEVTLPGPDCMLRPLEDCKEAEGPPHSGANEAELDARAAVAQAKLVKQPPDTAIYFGIDFELGAEGKEQAVQYFTIVSNELKDNGYLVGVYGDGAALSLLMGERHKTGRHVGQSLVDFTWLDASRGHAGAVDFYNRGEWDLFQSRTDLHLPSSASGSAEIDTDIQNPARAGHYVGFWNARGQYRVPQVRTKEVYDQRRFACSGRSPLREAPAPEAKAIGSLGLGSVVRIGEQQDGFVQVDRDEDGTYDGWTLVSNLSPTLAKRPEYVRDLKERRAAACLPSGPPATAAAVR